MHDDERQRGDDDGGDEAVEGCQASPSRESAVTSAYIEIAGETAFVIAARDRERAWIAVPRGSELDPDDYR